MADPLDAIKTYLGITGSDKDDFLNDLIAGVNKGVEEYLGFDPFSGADTYTEIWEGGGIRYYRVYNPAITSITSIHDDLNNDYDSDTLIDSDYYLLDNRDPFVATVLFTEFTPRAGIQNMKIIYEGGWAEASIPASIVLARKMEVAAIYNLSEEGFDGFSTQRLDAYSSTKEMGMNLINPAAEALLRNLRRRNV